VFEAGERNAKEMEKQAKRKTLRMPITNVYAKGGFSVAVSLGGVSELTNLVLDTGSSTVVVTQQAFESLSETTFSEQSLTATSFAQCVRYGMGGWYGPVIKTQLELLSNESSMQLDGTHISIAKGLKKGCFAEADGILGLAYHELNRAHNLDEYLSENNVAPNVTFPWRNTGLRYDTVKDFQRFLKSHPKQNIKPYFTQLEEQGVSANKFSFVTRRSSVHHHSPELSKEELKVDPLNQGLFILGGGEEDTDLYQGEFKRIRVIDDVYYNVRLLKVKLPGFKAFDVPKLKGKNLRKHHSNAFVDTGASVMILDDLVFNYIIDCLEKTNPNFKSILAPFLSFEWVEEGVDLAKLKLQEWPDIEFIFEASVDSEDDEVSIFCKADDYWQVNAPAYNKASFKIISQLPGWPDQSILGLPLLSDYYVIFARFSNEFGDIKFADIKLAETSFK
jgi:hypothetical protein